jgi:hypothetical protein
MKELTIRWEIIPGPPEQVIYFANDDKVGNGDQGFERIIKMIMENQRIEKVILKAPYILGFGGGRLESTFPFNLKYQELKSAVGKRALIIDYL